MTPTQMVKMLDGQLQEAFAQNGAQTVEIALLRAVMGRMHEGWTNALELGIIAERHRISATILRDEAHAALTVRK